MCVCVGRLTGPGRGCSSRPRHSGGSAAITGNSMVCTGFGPIAGTGAGAGRGRRQSGMMSCTFLPTRMPFRLANPSHVLPRLGFFFSRHASEWV